MAKANQSISRAIVILNIISQHEHLSVNQISRLSGLHKSTVHRFLQTLLSEKWLYRRAIDDHFQISENIPLLEKGVSNEQALAQRAGPLLKQAASLTTPWPMTLSIPDGTHMKLVEISGQSSYFKMWEDIADFKPYMLWSAMGRAYFSFCAADTRQVLLQQLKKSKDLSDRISEDHTWVERLIRDTRNQGYGIRDNRLNRPTDYEHEISAISVPVLKENHAVASVTLLWNKPEVSEQQMANQYLSIMQQTAKTILTLLPENLSQP